MFRMIATRSSASRSDSSTTAPATAILVRQLCRQRTAVAKSSRSTKSIVPPRFVLNADFGVYAFALGSAQKLQNGNYHICIGWLPKASGSLLKEVDPTGAIVYSMQNQRLEYRSFRMRDMYTPN